MPHFDPVPDPFPGKGPIPAEGVGFYERAELFTNIQNLLRAGESVSLVGERKAGKTSFLNYLFTNLSMAEFIPVQINTQLISPKTDQQFLGELVISAAEAIASLTNPNNSTDPNDSIEIKTLVAQPNQVYRIFREELQELRSKLQFKPNGPKLRLVWLIDEIEILRSYEQTELFSFLRPYAQEDPDFRFIVAGYDVLYTLSSRSEWSPFFNAFRHLRLEGLNPVVAQQLIGDALIRMKATIEPDLYAHILDWTGQKPFFLKWVLSKTAEGLNIRQVDHHVSTDVWKNAQGLFLVENDLRHHFDFLWDRHTTPSQRKVLSLIAAQKPPYYHPTILDQLKDKELIEGDEQALQHLIDDLTRLNQLGFLYEQVGRYTFTSGCLQEWISANKPL